MSENKRKAQDLKDQEDRDRLRAQEIEKRNKEAENKRQDALKQALAKRGEIGILRFWILISSMPRSRILRPARKPIVPVIKERLISL